MATRDTQAWPMQAGYHAGLAQPVVPLALGFECPPLVQFEALDAWLLKTLEITVAPLPRGPAASMPEAAAAGVAWRILHLSAALLRAVRIPVYHPGAILELRRDKAGTSNWLLKALVTRVDHVPPLVYLLAARVAARAVRWLLSRAPTEDNVRELYAQLDENFVRHATPHVQAGGESTVPLLREAGERGIPFRHMGAGTYQLGWGSRRLLLDHGSIGPDSAIGAHVACNKWRAAALLRAAGLPAPVHVPVGTPQAAADAAQRLGWPVVVKPMDRERGEGVTIGIRDGAQLARAYQLAASFSKGLLVEQHVEGTCHRLMVADGELQFVTKRIAKAVKGDGTSTVRELVAKANAAEQAKPPWSRLKPFPLDELALECLRRDGLAPDDVPAEGRWARLRPMQTSEWGGVVEDLTQAIHPDNAAAAIKAARVFGLAVAGIDMLSPDISRPWHENGAVINEVNFSPLLAGRNTSRAMAALLGRWLPGGGRIPVDAVVGGAAAMAEGLRLQAQRVAQGSRCWLASARETRAPGGETHASAAQGLFARCMALLADPEVDAVVIVVDDGELLRTGLPVDRIERVADTGDGPAEAAHLRALLGAYAAPADSM